MSGTKFKSQEEALEAISKAADEVETLMKSWGGLSKEEDEIQDTAEAATEPSPDELSEAPMEEAPPEEAPMEEAPAEEAPAEDNRAEMEQHASSLSDEDLMALLEVLSNEMEKRHAGQEEAAPAEAPAQDPELARSMKEEFSSLAKSFKTEIDGLKKSINSLRTENESLKKKISMPTSRPANVNASSVRTSEKVPAQVEKLNKSETVDYLLGEMRKGNRNVTSEHVALANASRDDDELDFVHSQIKGAGIDLPNRR